MIPLSLLTYIRVGNALNHLFSTRARGQNQNTLATTIENFLMRFKKGSKPIRNIMAEKRKLHQEAKLPQTLSTFFRITNLPVPENNELKKIASFWQTSTLPNRIKDFAFKFLYNKLHTNTRLSHMIGENNIDRGCTFCSISKLLPAPEETFQHLFWDCPTSQEILQKIIENYIPEIQRLSAEKQKLYFFTGTCEVTFPLIAQITRIIGLYLIWEMHQKKKILTWQTFKINLIYELRKVSAMCHHSKLGLHTGFHIAYNWDDICPETW